MEMRRGPARSGSSQRDREGIDIKEKRKPGVPPAFSPQERKRGKPAVLNGVEAGMGHCTGPVRLLGHWQGQFYRGREAEA